MEAGGSVSQRGIDNKWAGCCPFTSLFIDDTGIDTHLCCVQVLVRSDRVNVDPLLVIMAKEVGRPMDGGISSLRQRVCDC